MHRQVERGSGDEFLVVQIAGMGTWGSAGDSAYKRIRSDTDGTEKRSEFQTNAGREISEAGARIEAHEFDTDIWEFLRKRAAVGYKPPDAVRMKKLKTLDLDFQRIASLCALDPDRTSQRMRARASFLHSILNSFQRLGYLCVGNPGRAQTLHSAREDRLHSNRVARRYTKDGLDGRVVIAPMNIRGNEFQFMRLRRLRS